MKKLGRKIKNFPKTHRNRDLGTKKMDLDPSPYAVYAAILLDLEYQQL